QTDNIAIVIETEDNLQQIDFRKDIYLFSQTTKSLEGFNKLVKILQKKIVAPAQFHFFDTICRQVANRIPNIKKFAAEKDIILFVSDPKSSNGKQLFECCKSVNANSFFISYPSEIFDLQIDLAKKIGICGATSTPRWLMEKVADAVKNKI
ncbi:MAG: 4-hydroxy-3-methylbut-2-enyl diphosphate reductase, partial [Prevotellaceae bacterium]|nr:4-hydroxy-3-methylbut-2-enyl diphosphate reductase [Prevotellaceae bacterium]